MCFELLCAQVKRDRLPHDPLDRHARAQDQNDMRSASTEAQGIDWRDHDCIGTSVTVSAKLVVVSSSFPHGADEARFDWQRTACQRAKTPSRDRVRDE